MALVYGQLLYGFAVTDGVNNDLNFTENGVTGLVAELNPGLYYPDSFATEVARAMNAAGGDGLVTCQFNFSNATVSGVPTLSFKVAGTSTFSLLFGSGANAATNCATLLGFTSGGGAGNDKTGAASYTSTSPVGTAPSTATVWTLAEPVQKNSPVSAVAAGLGVAGVAALQLQRDIGAMQSISDGGTVETVWTRNMRKLRINFDQLLAAEATKMESFLDWAMKGQPFTWQPDKTSTGVVHLVMDLSNPKITNTYPWLTRTEISYGELVFLEQV